MSAILPRFKQGPTNYQVSTLIFGGQLVEPTTVTAGTTDLTVKPAGAASVNALGVAAADANVITAQTGAANTYGQPQIDISVLADYTAWYTNAAAANQGVKLIAAANGTVTPAGATPDARTVVGVCTHPGGVTVAMCNQQIGGTGAATFFLGRMRIF
jgi:hypothetical protein